MPYTPTGWQDVEPGQTPGTEPEITAANMNKIEQELVALDSGQTSLNAGQSTQDAQIAALQAQGAVLLSKGAQPHVGQGRATVLPSEYDSMLYGEPLSLRLSMDRPPTADEQICSPWPTYTSDGDLSAFDVPNLFAIPNARGNYAGRYYSGSTAGGSARFEMHLGSLADINVDRGSDVLTADNVRLQPYGNTSLADRVGDDRYYGYKIRVSSTSVLGGTWFICQFEPRLYYGRSGGFGMYLSDFAADKHVFFQWRAGNALQGPWPGGTSTVGYLETTLNCFANNPLSLDIWYDFIVHIVYRTGFGTGGKIQFFMRPEGGNWITGNDSDLIWPSAGGVPTLYTDGSEEGNAYAFSKFRSGLYTPGAVAGVQYGPLYSTGHCRGADFDSVDKYLAGQTVTQKWHTGRRYDREVLHLGPTVDLESKTGATYETINGNKLLANQLTLANDLLKGYTALPTSVAISIASPGVVTHDGNHPFVANDNIFFSTTGALPTGLTPLTTYYVKTVLSSTTFTVSATAGGAVINTTGTQSGTHTINNIDTPYSVDRNAGVNYSHLGRSPVKHIDTTIKAVSITLPYLGVWVQPGDTYTFIDVGNNLVNNNLTILPGGTNTIEGASSLVVNKNGATIKLQYIGGDWKIVSEQGQSGYYPGGYASGEPNIRQVLGLIACTGQPRTSIAVTLARVYFSAIWLPKGVQVSNIIMGKAGTDTLTATDIRVGLFDSAGTRFAQSASLTASFNGSASAALLSFPLISAYTIPADGVYYLAFWQKDGTAAALATVDSTTILGQVLAGHPRYYAQQDSATFPTNAALVAPALNQTPWFGIT